MSCVSVFEYLFNSVMPPSREGELKSCFVFFIFSDCILFVLVSLPLEGFRGLMLSSLYFNQLLLCHSLVHSDLYSTFFNQVIRCFHPIDQLLIYIFRRIYFYYMCHSLFRCLQIDRKSTRLNSSH